MSYYLYKLSLWARANPEAFASVVTAFYVAVIIFLLVFMPAIFGLDK